MNKPKLRIIILKLIFIINQIIAALNDKVLNLEHIHVKSMIQYTMTTTQTTKVLI